MNDETERALRALMCQWCKDGHKLESSGVHRIEKQHQTFDDFAPCTYKPEFLHLFQQGIAGAYAAAAKHRFAKWSASYRCTCGAVFSDSLMEAEDQWVAHIRSLTPADARQAQEKREADIYHEAQDDMRTEHEAAVYGLELQIGNLNYELMNTNTDLSAAIASAEARARKNAITAAGIMTNCCQILDVVKPEWAECWSEWDQSVRDSMTKWLTEHYAEAAARTPDSTKEPE